MARTRIQVRDLQGVEEDASVGAPGGQPPGVAGPAGGRPRIECRLSRFLSHGVEMTQGGSSGHLFVGNRISSDRASLVRSAESGPQPPGIEGVAPRRVGPEDPPHVVLISNENGVMEMLRTRVKSLDGPGFSVEEGVKDLMLHWSGERSNSVVFPGHQGVPAPADDAVADESGSGPGNPWSGSGEVVLTVEIPGEIGELEIEEAVEPLSRGRQVQCAGAVQVGGGGPEIARPRQGSPDPVTVSWRKIRPELPGRPAGAPRVRMPFVPDLIEVLAGGRNGLAVEDPGLTLVIGHQVPEFGPLTLVDSFWTWGLAVGLGPMLSPSQARRRVHASGGAPRIPDPLRFGTLEDQVQDVVPADDQARCPRPRERTGQDRLARPPRHGHGRGEIAGKFRTGVFGRRQENSGDPIGGAVVDQEPDSLGVAGDLSSIGPGERRSPVVAACPKRQDRSQVGHGPEQANREDESVCKGSGAGHQR